MGSYQYQQRSCVVATAPVTSRAEFIQVTLAAHGIQAMISASAIYPSIDFVEGIGVFVREEDEARANQILGALGLDTGRTEEPGS